MKSPDERDDGGPPLAALADRLIRCRGRFGISRIGDLTGLDRLGIPVVQAVRPLACSNAVSQGKGLDLCEAVVSAVLEAAETFFAERIGAMDTFQATAEELAFPPGWFERHLRGDAPKDWRRLPVAWARGTNILGGGQAPVPFELVHTYFAQPPLATDGVFAGSTTGLAAAPDRARAVLHGLLETIERDAVARGRRTHGLFVHSRISASSVTDEPVRDLLEKLLAAGLLVGLWALDGAGGVPAIWCQLLESGDRPLMLPFPAEGFAAHPDAGMAVRKAVIEAAQARLAAISGARDDITRAAYPRRIDWQMVEGARRLLRDGPQPVDFGAIADGAAASLDGLDGILGALCRAGIDAVIVVEVGHDAASQVHCVRVLAPALEPLLE